MVYDNVNGSLFANVEVGDVFRCLYPQHGEEAAPLIPRLGRVEKVASWGITLEIAPGEFRSFAARKWVKAVVKRPIRVC